METRNAKIYQWWLAVTVAVDNSDLVASEVKVTFY